MKYSIWLNTPDKNQIQIKKKKISIQNKYQSKMI